MVNKSKFTFPTERYLNVIKKGYEDCEIIYVKSEEAPKATKKLTLRNFPSIVLFYDGSKK